MGHGRRRATVWVMLCGLALPLWATELSAWQISSGPQRTVMIELYTSQGCSSCPPAEQFLNGFVDHPGLWRRFIPLALHVDYWDYLGWKDRFALADNARRQRRYATLGHVRGVYTPAFLVNGRGWRPGWLAREPAVAEDTAGSLSASVAAGRVEVRYDGPSAAGQLELHLAVLGMGLASDIAAGENRGRHSRHDFVVLAHDAHASGDGRWQVALPRHDGAGAERLALVAWLSRPGDPTPLQAVGGYLPVRATAAD